MGLLFGLSPLNVSVLIELPKQKSNYKCYNVSCTAYLLDAKLMAILLALSLPRKFFEISSSVKDLRTLYYKIQTNSELPPGGFDHSAKRRNSYALVDRLAVTFAVPATKVILSNIQPL
jgi:hypothetical protein